MSADPGFQRLKQPRAVPTPEWRKAVLTRAIDDFVKQSMKIEGLDESQSKQVGQPDAPVENITTDQVK